MVTTWLPLPWDQKREVAEQAGEGVPVSPVIGGKIITVPPPSFPFFSLAEPGHMTISIRSRGWDSMVEITAVDNSRARCPPPSTLHPPPPRIRKELPKHLWLGLRLTF